MWFVAVIKRRPVHDETSQMIYGGNSGVRLFVITCVRIFNAVYFAESTQSPQLSIPCAVAPSFVLDYLLTAVTLSHDEITCSAKPLQAARAQDLNFVSQLQDVSNESSAQRIPPHGDDTRMNSASPARVESPNTLSTVCISWYMHAKPLTPTRVSFQTNVSGQSPCRPAISD